MAPNDTLEKMALAYESGASFRDIAALMGCSKSTARVHLQAFGVKSNRSRSIAAKAIGRASPRKGAVLSDATREKIRTARLGGPGTRFGPHSAETLAKISAANRGKNVKHSPERKREIERARQACKRFVSRVLRSTGKRKSIRSEMILGYTKLELLAHLGPRPDGAHIDHYVPIAEFLRRGYCDPRVINALPNLRWLSGPDNQRKSASVPQDCERVIALCSYTPGLA